MRTASIRRKAKAAGLLYRLIYRSQEAITRSDVAVRDELTRVLATARRRNATDDITGALLFTSTGFSQVLEGRRDVVERTFERISADPRHTDVMVLSFTPTERRTFPEWPMAFCGWDVSAATPPEAALGRQMAATDVLRYLERTVSREDLWVAA